MEAGGSGGDDEDGVASGPRHGEEGLKMLAGQAVPVERPRRVGGSGHRATLGRGVPRDGSGPMEAGTREGPASQLPARF